MKITNIEKVGPTPVYDLTVDEAQAYILGNGVITHNTAVEYFSNQVFFISRAQDKDATGLVGYRFNYKTQKSRFVKEQSILPLDVTFDGGISKWSGLLELAVKSGHVIKPSNGWYVKTKLNEKTGELEEVGTKCREKDTDTEAFWLPILKETGPNSFAAWVEQTFRLGAGGGGMIENNETIESFLGDDE